jgi:hypothetical protein
LPKICGLAIAGVQMHGVFPRYHCDYNYWRTCI